jgi:hypothetical protein
MHTPWVVVWAAVLGIAGCLGQIQMQTRFEPGEYRSYLKHGTSTLKGQGFLRQAGGSVVTCAGEEVDLVPETPFFLEALRQVEARYVNNGRSDLAFSYWKRWLSQLEYDIDPAYRPVLKHTQCDAQGNFAFNEVPPGRWLVSTQVVWEVASSSQGGFLTEKALLGDGTTHQVLLTKKHFR